MKNIPQCIHITQDKEANNYELEFPLATQGFTFYSNFDKFDDVLAKIKEVAREFNVDLSNYSLVVQ